VERSMLRLPLPIADCEVRSWQVSDAASLASHANNRKIWLNLRDVFPHPYTFEHAQCFLEAVVEAEPEMNFCIACEGEAIGGIGLKPSCDVERFSAEIGYWLGEDHWSRGIATAAIRAVTEHGLDFLGLHRIFAMPYARNAPSCRALEKAGYQLEGRLKEHSFKDGKFEDQFMYAVTK
jgi:[ribosomal protein S5]-alanine N-acetyltransferase